MKKNVKIQTDSLVTTNAYILTKHTSLKQKTNHKEQQRQQKAVTDNDRRDVGLESVCQAKRRA